jgi:hypothetical protein
VGWTSLYSRLPPATSGLRRWLHPDGRSDLEWLGLGGAGLRAQPSDGAASGAHPGPAASGAAAARTHVPGRQHPDGSPDLEWLGLGGTGLHKRAGIVCGAGLENHPERIAILVWPQ